jgi:preprotein translocase subunit YajC
MLLLMAFYFLMFYLMVIRPARLDYESEERG